MKSKPWMGFSPEATTSICENGAGFPRASILGRILELQPNTQIIEPILCSALKMASIGISQREYLQMFDPLLRHVPMWVLPTKSSAL